MAKKTNADYKREQYQRKLDRQELIGEKDIVTPIPLSVWAMIQDLCTWHSFKDWRELLITMVRVCHGLGAEGNVFVQIPKSGFVPTEDQLRAVQKVVQCPDCYGRRFIKLNGFTEPCTTCEGWE